MDTALAKRLSEDKGVALVEFYATWCPHCQRMMPIVDDVKALLDGRANVYQFDIDENQELAEQLGASSIPAFIVYKDGNEMWRGAGEMDGDRLVAHIEEFL